MTALTWILVGLLLILSELLLTNVIAVFIGIGALITGLLLWLGLIDSLATQMWVFSLVSIASLLLARKKLKMMFVGNTLAQGASGMNFQQDLGARVQVQSDFKQGVGRVILNGVAWNASSNDQLKKDDVAWVVANNGIQLTVSQHPPESNP